MQVQRYWTLEHMRTVLSNDALMRGGRLDQGSMINAVRRLMYGDTVSVKASDLQLTKNFHILAAIYCRLQNLGVLRRFEVPATPYRRASPDIQEGWETLVATRLQLKKRKAELEDLEAYERELLDDVHANLVKVGLSIRILTSNSLEDLRNAYQE